MRRHASTRTHIHDASNKQPPTTIPLHINQHILFYWSYISKDSDELLRLVLPVLQPDVARIDATYTREGSLEQWITITQAKLAQLAALHLIDEVEAEVLGAGVGCQVNEELHYVGSSYLADALVFGKSVRAVCGRWFVPTKDAHASLPLCASCERKLPVAQQVAGLIQLFQRR